ncbi:MAG: xanthine dehydrogenase family protein molybdopterin-binding subunit [Treponema sp.]|jgi:carbon-monoxide dehydrogenase large subunit|nr:xanthine dehydrogenase family protein molybdopterin-binding subunit [Treponema sp.]
MPEQKGNNVIVRDAGDAGTMGSFKYVGKPLIRNDALAKAAGRAVFGSDIRFPNQLYGAVLQSPHAHAKILSLDVSEAEELPGVVTVITGKDFTGLFGQFIVDQRVLAFDKVRYNGEPVAAVAAETEALARQAIKRIKVEYEALEPVLDPVEALEEGAPLVHEKWSGYARSSEANPRDGTNLCDYFRLRHGDTKKGFAESDLVIENEFRTSGVHHSTIETHCATAQYDGLSNLLTIWSPAQSPFLIRKQLASLFGIPQKNVRLICTMIGGGFGSKYELKVEPIAAALAYYSGGRPVRIVFTRKEDYLGGCVRGMSVIRIKTGVTIDGFLKVQKMEVFYDTGAYSTTGPRINYNAGLASITPYKIPNVSIDGYTVVTNRHIAAPYRGFGKPEICFAYENQMDIIAEKLNMDPLEFRLRNIYRSGDISAAGETLPDVGTEKCLRGAAELIGWEEGYKARVTPEGKFRAKAIACGCKLTGTPSGSSVVLKFNEDATVTVLCGGTELGQGTNTVIAQIVAERLGLPYENIEIAPVDTMYTPYEKTTTGSRLTYHTGNAALKAAGDVISQIKKLAAISWGVEVSAVTFEDGVIAGPGGQNIRLEEIGKSKILSEQEPVIGRGQFATSDIFVKPDADHQSEKPTAQWFWMAHAVEIEVDPATGKTEILKYAAAQDVGQAINTMNCVQQVEGGVAMGLGHALTEELIYDDKGRLLNGNMVDFKIPTAMDVDFETGVILVENPVRDGPFGARGIGEPPVVPVAAVISCAVSRATGIRMKGIPLKACKVLKILKDEGKRRI